MSVTGLESTKGDGMGVFARKNRLQVDSVITAGEALDTTEAQVSTGRLHTKSLPDNSSRTVTTSQHTVDDSAAVTIASAEADRESLVIQNHLAGPIGIVLGTGTPGANDFQIAAGATFVLPFPYDGVVKAKGMNASVSGNVVVIRAKT